MWAKLKVGADKGEDVIWSELEVGPKVLAEPYVFGEWVRRLGRAWYRGWLAFGSASGGSAEDLVTGNPWHGKRAWGGRHAER